MDAERLERWLDRTELPMLVLATAAVAGYLVDLHGAWVAVGLDGAWQVIGLAIDVAFLVDLLAKVALLRWRYVATPWFLVDLVCTVPILSALGTAPTALAGLRFVRAFRVLRALRTLRGLRSLRILRFLSRDTETVEQRRFDIVLSVAVTLYSALFVGLVQWGRVQGVGNPDTAELYLVLGSLLGMLLVLVVARFQIPALWAGQMRAILNVALPQQVADYLMKHPEAYDQTVRAPATVIFADIKGFTQTVESLSLDEVKTHLEMALDAVVEAHVAQDLIIDKFIGDAVMSFRGGNLVSGTPEDHAVRVVRGALNGAAALRELDDAWFRDVKVGGASGTDLLIGTFGTSKRLSYTVLGDRVNLAARLEGSCNAIGVRNLFCDRTRTLCAGAADLVWRRVGTMRVQGRDEVMVVWEAYRDSEPTGWIEPFHRALERYEAQDFAAALDRFEQVDGGVIGGDGPSRIYAETCRKLLAEGVPDGWSPVLATKK